MLQTTASSSLRHCSVLVQNAWGNLKEAGLRAHLSSGGQTDERRVNQARLEASSSNLSRKLVELFEQLFFTPKVTPGEVLKINSLPPLPLPLSKESTTRLTSNLGSFATSTD